ncbi:STAS domain-containing protein [Nocardia sp. NPDC059764]|uniref:STAS domain-containing protein n=1 Tax=Nocardia sp. NPDC059764 TaxID=3346939 RepID=UPI00365F2B24
MTDRDDPSAVSELVVEHRMAGEVAIVTVRGEVDAATGVQLEQAVRTCLASTRGGFCVLDLTVVRFLGGHGLAVLLKVSRSAEKLHQPLRIVVDSNRPVVAPIEITGLEEFLALYHSVEEALRP